MRLVASISSLLLPDGLASATFLVSSRTAISTNTTRPVVVSTKGNYSGAVGYTAVATHFLSSMFECMIIVRCF